MIVSFAINGNDFAPRLQTVDQAQYVQTLIERDRDGYSPRESLFTGLGTQFGLPSGVAETLLNDYRAGFPNSCVLFPDAVGTLSCLRASGLRLGLITNGSIHMQRRKLECLALSPLFDTILISDAEGVSKPDREIFHRALERLDTHPAQAAFVGDHPDLDVAGARAAGMQADGVGTAGLHESSRPMASSKNFATFSPGWD